MTIPKIDNVKEFLNSTFMKNNEVMKNNEENFIENTVNEEEVDTMSNKENIEGFSFQGGKKRRKGSSKKRGTRSTKKRVVKRKTTRKKSTKKKGPSKWIMHVKAFCKKTGKNFPEALKDPMCRKTFKH